MYFYGYNYSGDRELIQKYESDIDRGCRMGLYNIRNVSLEYEM